MTTERDYAFRAKLDLPYEQALAKIGDALKTEDFGILTSVDIQATLREKIGAEFRRYIILGVCNPLLAQRALSQDLEAGLLLPCTILIYEEGIGSAISIADPMAMVNLLGNPMMRPIAEEAAGKLKRVLKVMEGEGS